MAKTKAHPNYDERKLDPIEVKKAMVAPSLARLRPRSAGAPAAATPEPPALTPAQQDTHAVVVDLKTLQSVWMRVVVDGSKFIRSSISAVQEDMLLGGILAIVVVLVFLRNYRSTLVSAVALPTSIVGTFAVMRALGFTFNVITMLALTLSIGLLIDDAIVVIENIVRHVEEGESPWEAARKGTGEIALAVLAVTLSVVAVFVPVAFMEGIMGRFMYQFGVTVAVAVLISYLVSMTLTPMLSARVIKEHVAHGRIFEAIERALSKPPEKRFWSWICSALYAEDEQVQPTPAMLNCGLGRKKLSGRPAAERPIPCVRRSSASAMNPTLLFLMSA